MTKVNQAVFNHEKMYTFLKGYAIGKGMTETLKALSYARQKHADQKRKDGEPYIVHPLTMACNATALDISDDTTMAAILLHDVVEDVLPLMRRAKDEYPELSNTFFQLKYHITSVLNAIDLALKAE